MNALILLNDPPYGTERSYNGLRLAGAMSGQTTPQGYYNLGRMLQVVSGNRGEVGVCGSCMDARGIRHTELLEGTKRSTVEELANWVPWANHVLVF